MNTFQQSKRIYFVGLKGVAMASLAIWAKEAGKIVAGSDVSEEFPTDDELRKAKIAIHEEFDVQDLVVFNPDVVIYTGAHGGQDNPLVLEALKRGIPSIPHGKALGMAMEGKRQIAVAGSHGKTTTAAMIAMILTEAGLDPSYTIGCGSIRGLGAAGHAGGGDWFVAEADEYVTDPGHDATPRFLWQKPEVLVVTNIDYDHPDAYPDLLAVQQAFIALQKQSKFTFICAEDEASSVLRRADNIATFGLSEKLNELKLQIPGRHNMLNAAAAVAACSGIGIGWETIKRGLARFGGTKRRFEEIGHAQGIIVYDDYAHHPREIQATIAGARAWYPKKRIISVFQPHTYSRTKALLSDFATSFIGSDIVVIADIYASAREKDTLGITSIDLVRHIETRQGNVQYQKNYAAVSAFLRKEAKNGDVILFMGAGDISGWSKQMIHDWLH